MDSLIRGGLTQGVSFSPSNPTYRRTSQSSFTSNLHFPSNTHFRFNIRASSSSSSSALNAKPPKNPILWKIKVTAGTLILTVATALMIVKFSKLPSRREIPVVPFVEEQNNQEEDDESEEEWSFKEFVNARIQEIKSVLGKKLESVEDEEALKSLVSDQLTLVEGKLVVTGILNEFGNNFFLRKIIESFMRKHPIPFDSLFQNILLMDQIGEGGAIIDRLEKTLNLNEEKTEYKKDRSVRFVIAQVEFLKKNFEKALEIYQILAKEKPKDYRPYFCQGVIYTLLDRNNEAKEQFEMGRKLSPKEFDEVERFLQNIRDHKSKTQNK